MRPEQYQMLADRQQTYWWHCARRSMALGLLRRYGLSEGCEWLDIGCGPGGNFGMLDPLAPKTVAGMDVSTIALDLARQHAPAAVLVRGDVNDPLPFADESFDVVTIFNVLYHDWVRNEAAVFAEVARVLRRDGLLLFTEPAFDVLEREMDDAVMTRRRYRNADFDPLLTDAGFETLFSSYFTSFGVPILLAAKWLKRPKDANKPGIDMRPIPKTVNDVFAALAGIEGRLLRARVRMPFGTTLVRVARRLPLS